METIPASTLERVDPEFLHSDRVTIFQQSPTSPVQPRDADKADPCSYTGDSINDGEHATTHMGPTVYSQTPLV
jgi:hypothetical protein